MTPIKKILQPFNRKLMDDTYSHLEIDWLALEGISGEKDVVNELLDYVNDKIAKTGLTRIFFSKWGKIDGDIESQIMTVIANKTRRL